MADKKKSTKEESTVAKAKGEETTLPDDASDLAKTGSDDTVADTAAADIASAEPEVEGPTVDDASDEPDPASGAQDADPLPIEPSDEDVALEGEIVEPQDMPEGENFADDEVASDTDAPEDPVSGDEAEEPVSALDRVDSEPENDPVYPSPAPAPAPERQSSAGVGTMLVGGILAGVIGYLLASANLLPAPWKAVDPAIGELRNEVEAQAEVIEAQGAMIEGLEGGAAPTDLSPLEAQIAEIGDQLGGLEGRLGEVSDSIAALTTRVESLEARPVSDGNAAPAPAPAPAPEVDLSAYEAQLAELKETVRQQREDVEEMIANARALEEQATAAQRRAVIQSAVARLQTALEQGTPFQDVIANLNDVGADVPEALDSAAGDGVATLSTLRSGFPDAARDALARERSGSERRNSLGAFLQRQLGARSVEPREGDDTDAVLSRIEASLASGNLANALAELEALPEETQSDLSDWAALAQQRLRAQQAVEELAASATEN